jgi:hypothetical protein
MKARSGGYQKSDTRAQHWYVDNTRFNKKPLSSPTDPLSIGMYTVRVSTKILFYHLLINQVGI